MKKILFLLSMVLVLLLGVNASADTISFDLGVGNAAISGYPGPYAHVVVDLTSNTTATITFTSLTNSGNIYLMGDGSSVAVNVHATSWTLGPVTGFNGGTGFTPGGSGYTDAGAQNVDGFGIFNQVIDSPDGFKNSADKITFTLTDTSGTWASAADVLTTNADGYLAAAHIFVTSSPADAHNTVLATGYAATPEPSTMMIVASGLIGMGIFARRKLHRK